MTVEEIEIIVTTKVENALKNFKKLTPAIKKQIQTVQEEVKSIDLSSYKQQIDNAVKFTKKKIDNLKGSNKNNEIKLKVNNADAQKQITQTQKQIDSLQEKINARQFKLDIVNATLDKKRDETNQKVIQDMPEAGNKAIKQETYKRLNSDTDYTSLVKESDKLSSEISKYNSLLDTAKSKMAELGVQTSQTANNQSRLSGFIGNIKGKIEQAKNGSSSLKNSFEKIPKAVQSISQNIGKMSKGLKGGLSHVLKYAGALFSIRGIYSLLRGTANAWLSSQDAGAKQLTANIEYMKYAMRKCTCSSYSICY